MLPVRIAEGTTIHSLQGINVGATKQVERLAVDLGKEKCETQMPGLSLVATSRPESKRDMCFATPVSLERLRVCGTGIGAAKLRAAYASFREKASTSDACKFVREDYDALLAWLVRYAKTKHGIDAPWGDK